MIAPIQAYDRGTHHPKPSYPSQSDDAPEPTREASGISPSTFIGDNPVIAVVSAVTLGVLVGWLVKRKLGQ